MDRFSKSTRSAIMSRIRSKNTSFEKRIISSVVAKTKVRLYFNDASIIGKPDIVNRKKRACVFLDSDFWHGWRYPLWKTKLSPFWKKKIESNRLRDKKVNRILRRKGWKVMRVWEHQLDSDFDKQVKNIVSFLTH